MRQDKYNKGLAHKGFGLLEVLLAIGILAIFLSGTAFLMVDSAQAVNLYRENIQATALAQEGLEAAYSIRNRGWSNITTGTYGLDRSPGYWRFFGSFDQQGIFKRTVRIMEVCIPVNDVIFSLCGLQSGRLMNQVDPNARRVRVTIEWTSASGTLKTLVRTGLVANY